MSHFQSRPISPSPPRARSAARRGPYAHVCNRPASAARRARTRWEGTGRRARCGRADEGRHQYSKPLPPMNSRKIEVGGTWSG